MEGSIYQPPQSEVDNQETPVFDFYVVSPKRLALRIPDHTDCLYAITIGLPEF